MASSDLVVDDQDGVSEWLRKARMGDDLAFEKLWHRYFTALVNLARSQLQSRAVTFADEFDIVQSVMLSWYVRVKNGEFPNLNDRDGLWKLLLSITLNKSRALNRKEGRRRELLQDRFKNSVHNCEPTAELAIEFADLLQRLMGLLDGEELLQTIAREKICGLTNREIALKTGKAVPTIERKLQIIRGIWAAEMCDSKV
jgi:DNA-directed RNA polymerase specialized sigma24 family protein